jgi:cytochrome c-type biogenesis protein CcmE
MSSSNATPDLLPSSPGLDPSAEAPLAEAIARRQQARRGRWLKIVGSLVVVGGVVAYMLSTTLTESLEYFHPADVVIVKGDTLVGQRIRMGGHVVKGSIFQKPGTLLYQFEVTPLAAMAKHPEALGKSITVRYDGVVPDTFKDDAEVVVTGKLGPDHVFVATDLLAKCPSKYEAAQQASASASAR